MITEFLPDFSYFHLAVVCTALSLGGFVKGVSAFGLPTIAVPIIVFFMSLPSAVAIIVLPMIITNFVQMMATGHIKTTVTRHWRLLLALYVSLPFGVYLLSTVNTNYLLIGVGCFLITVASLEIFGVSFSYLTDREKLFGPIIGLFAGIIGGITTLYGTLPVFFFVALGLDKEKFVAVVSVTLFTGSIILMLSLNRANFINPIEIVYGLVGLIPLFIGMWAGTKVRHSVDQVTFRKIVLMLVMLIGIIMIYRAVA
jgi:uncharacterized protein